MNILFINEEELKKKLNTNDFFSKLKFNILKKLNVFNCRICTGIDKITLQSDHTCTRLYASQIIALKEEEINNLLEDEKICLSEKELFVLYDM